MTRCRLFYIKIFIKLIHVDWCVQMSNCISMIYYDIQPMTTSHYPKQCWLMEMICGIHLRANLYVVLMNLICNKCSEITRLKLLPGHLPGTNELHSCDLHTMIYTRAAAYPRYEYVFSENRLHNVGHVCLDLSLLSERYCMKLQIKCHSYDLHNVLGLGTPERQRPAYHHDGCRCPGAK